MGRAARNERGHVVFYADRITGSMARTIEETTRRRQIQDAYNKAHGIKPTSIKKSVREVIEATMAAEGEEGYEAKEYKVENLHDLIVSLEEAMFKAAEELEFERAANLRDEIRKLKSEIA